MKAKLIFIAVMFLVAFTGCGNIKTYNEARTLYDDGYFAEAAEAFSSLEGYQDADVMARLSEYNAAIKLFENGDYAAAYEMFISFGNYNDSVKYAEESRIERDYAEATAFLTNGDYTEALEAFTELGDFKDAVSLAGESRMERNYAEATAILANGDYAEALEAFKELGDFKDAVSLMEEARSEWYYLLALESLEEGNYDHALRLLKGLGDFKDAPDHARETQILIDTIKGNDYDAADALFAQGELGKAQLAFEALGNFKDAPARAKESQNEQLYIQATQNLNAGNYSLAAGSFENLKDYKDSADRVIEARDSEAAAQTLHDTLKYNTSSARNFKPKNPQAGYYFASAAPVIDPKTGNKSTGGYNRTYSRHYPVDQDDVLRTSSGYFDGLSFTTDPNRATYVLIVNFSYHLSRYDSNWTAIYEGTTKAELRNLVTGKSIYTDALTTFWGYAGETVQTSMLDAGRGKQFYAQSKEIYSSDFADYDSLVP